MHHLTLGAGASMPLSADVGIGLHYSTQSFNGAYGTTIAPNISEHKNALSGNVTYRIPHTDSTVNFQSTTSRYSDPNVPSYNFNQNEQDLNFTIRF